MHRLFVVLVVVGSLLAVAPFAAAQTLAPFAGSVGGGFVKALAVQPDGRILVGGNFTSAGVSCGPTTCPTTRNRIARFMPDGSLDSGFNPGANTEVNTIVVQPDGRILVGGLFTTIGGGTGTTTRRGLARLNADGSVDATFDPAAQDNGPVTAILLNADGSMIVSATRLKRADNTVLIRQGLGRILADGTIDELYRPGFTGGTSSNVTLAMDSTGRLLVGGGFLFAGSNGTVTTPRQRIARFLANGDLDTTFNPGVNNPAGASSSVQAIVIQPDGKILVGGTFSSIGGGTGTTARLYLARIDDTGTVEPFDASITNNGNSGGVSSLALQADGRILVAGFFVAIGGVERLSFGRVNADGSHDAAFSPAGINNQIFAVALENDGDILLGGAFQTTNAAARNRIARFVNSAAAAETLSVSGGGVTLTWARAGTSADPVRVTFETTTDGVTWTSLGAGSRIAGGWQLTGLSLPANPIVRARAFVATGWGNGSGSIVQTTLIPVSTNIVQNPGFASGTVGWSQFATPDPSYMISDVTAGVFRFYRLTPPAGTSNQALVFRQTGLPLPANAPLTASFQLGNSDNARKRVSVLVHDSNFTDLTVCTFWLPANAPLQTYGITAHTTQAWTDATISFYAATAGSSGGFYLLDNVSITYTPANPATETICIDPTSPTPSGGAIGPNLLANGDFSSGTLAPGWSTFGQITTQITGNVLEFVRPPGTPAGVVLQATTQAMTSGEILTAAFQLGNSSAVRKRVTVIIHDNDFSDLSACTFWLNPGQALSTYNYRTFTTKAWTNATFSLYPATVGTDQWIRLDNVSLQREPASTGSGVECLEPGSAIDAWTTVVAPRPVSRLGMAQRPAYEVESHSPSDDMTLAAHGTEWFASALDPETRILAMADALDVTDDVRLSFRSWLSAHGAQARVEIATDGEEWETVFVARQSDAWTVEELSLSAYAGQSVRVRFVFQAGASGVNEDGWRIGDVTFTTAPVIAENN